jgi:hypothetical protein
LPVLIHWVKGTIEIDIERKTLSIRLDNGSYCLDHYTIGIKRFLEEEIQFVSEDTRKKRKEMKKKRPNSAFFIFACTLELPFQSIHHQKDLGSLILLLTVG